MMIITEKDNITTNCVRCEQPVQYTQLYDFDGEDGYCFECYIGGSGRRLVLDHGYKPIPIFCHMSTEKEDGKHKLLYLGIELEVEHRNLNLQNYSYTIQKEYGIYVKHDGSLQRGFELVSHPQTAKYHQKVFNWYKLLEQLRTDRFTSYDNGRCGLHIHVNKDFFNNRNDMLKLALFFYKCFNRLKRFSKRRNMDFCKKWKDSLITYVSKDKRKTNLIMTNEDRYSCINVQNATTIEIRIYKGTLNYGRFLASILFTDAVCHFVKNYSIAFFHNPTNDMSYLWNEFLKYVKINGRYDFLERYLVRNDLDNNKTTPLSGLPEKEDYIGNKKSEYINFEFISIDLCSMAQSAFSVVIPSGIVYEVERTEFSGISTDAVRNYFIFAPSLSGTPKFILPKFASRMILYKHKVPHEMIAQIIRLMYDMGNYVVNVCEGDNVTSNEEVTYRKTIYTLLDMCTFMGGDSSDFSNINIDVMLQEFISSCSFHYEVVRSDYVDVYNNMQTIG